MARAMFRTILGCLPQVIERMTQQLADGGNSSCRREYGPYSGMRLITEQQNTESLRSSGVARGSFAR